MAAGAHHNRFTGDPAERALDDRQAIAHYGSIRFPASRKNASKYAIVPHSIVKQGRVCKLVRMMKQTWKLPKPSVLISVTGACSKPPPAMFSCEDGLCLLCRGSKHPAGHD